VSAAAKRRPDVRLAVDVSELNLQEDQLVALEPGHLVMTGALHAAVPMGAGDVFRAEFDRLGTITIRVAARLT